MPPKKKKVPVNVVVGTVSTRSTRRQSVVNIEIPKTKRSPTKKPTAKEETDIETNLANLQTEPHIDKDVPKKIRQPRISAGEGRVTRRSSTQVPRRGRSLGSLPDSNRELLKILDDWTDEEGQDKTDTSSMGYTESECGSSVGIENPISGTEELKTTFENQFKGLSQENVVEEVVTEEISTVEGTEVLEDAYQIEPPQECQDSANNDVLTTENNSPCMESEDAAIIIENTSSSSGMCIPEVVEEQCIVEENVIIEDSQEAKDEIVVECVTDEVISAGGLTTDENSDEINQASYTGLI
ncbi:unnamed protein product [Acanthoscelides obtectus]|uniref:Uncharacterized protein n=1 Tax=Acanthoscelides obtectus TaxID=200917 RepID=A0A9P0NS90_ACAOB|nr:unnamed protein product [Acanthoscelides obtectus]CAK1639659.1 hypothetical protein AOBTE_LOCUS11297 [Acanthoscelides obtectus]